MGDEMARESGLQNGGNYGSVQILQQIPSQKSKSENNYYHQYAEKFLTTHSDYLDIMAKMMGCQDIRDNSRGSVNSRSVNGGSVNSRSVDSIL